MRVLLAAPDRDLLTSYQKLMENNGDEVTAAFDGFQFMACLQEKKYDLVLLDRSLPRVDHDRLMRLVNDLGIPAIVFQGMRMNAGLLLKEQLADSYLIYPFEPEEFFERLREIKKKRESRQVTQVGELRVDLGTFLMDGKIRLTNEEINILDHLTKREAGELPMKHGMYYVNALNQKLERLGKKMKIQYKMNEGYELVK